MWYSCWWLLSIYGSFFTFCQGTMRGNHTIEKGVIVGVPALPKEFPWMAAILHIDSSGKPNATSVHCGGAILSNKFILTTANCVWNYDRNQILVRLGMNKVSAPTASDGEIVDFNVDFILKHPLYDPKEQINDLALVRVSNNIAYNEFIHPINLPNKDIIVKSWDNNPVTVVGWGPANFSIEGYVNKVLKRQEAVVIAQAKCEKVSGIACKDQGSLRQTHICVGAAGSNENHCYGDSGGVVVHRERGFWFLIGVISYECRCTSPGFPSVASRITSYLNWIYANTNQTKAGKGDTMHIEGNQFEYLSFDFDVQS